MYSQSVYYKRGFLIYFHFLGVAFFVNKQNMVIDRDLKWSIPVIKNTKLQFA